MGVARVRHRLVREHRAWARRRGGGGGSGVGGRRADRARGRRAGRVRGGGERGRGGERRGQRQRGGAGGAADLVGLGQRQAQGLHLAHDAVDVDADGGEVVEALGTHRQLDDPGDELAQAGVEQAQAVLGGGDDLVHPPSGVELGLEGLGGGDQRRVLLELGPGRELAELGGDRPEVDPGPGLGQGVAALGDLPALLDAGVDAILDLAEAVLERARPWPA